MVEGKTIQRLLLVFVAVLIIGAATFVNPASARAQTDGKEIGFNAALSLADNLAAFKNKTVTVTLSSGQAVTGTVSDVKNGLLHLTKISQREFYDALIVIDRINSVEARVR